MQIKMSFLKQLIKESFDAEKEKDISDEIVKLVDGGLDTDEAVNQYIKDNPGTSDVVVAKALKANPINNAADAAYIKESSGMKIKISELTSIVEEECRGYLESLLPHEGSTVDLEEGDEMSRTITQIETIGDVVMGVVGMIDNPEAIERLERVDEMITDLLAQMQGVKPAGLE